MKPITRRAALPAIATALTSLAAAPALTAAPETPPEEKPFPFSSLYLELLKKAMQPFATQWQMVKYDDRAFYFCRENLPFYEVSRYNVHGWYQTIGTGDERLFHVWTVRTHGIGDIRIDIDESAGIVSVMGLEGKMKGKLVSSYALASVAP
jgi:hypothetical protein